MSGGVYALGQLGGMEAVSLTPATLPSHTHRLRATPQTGDTADSTDTLLAQPVTSATDPTPHPLYGDATNLTTLSPDTVSVTGNGGAHNNMQPYLVMNYCICTNGYYPPRT
jgi:microcystin-dependent protein